MYYKIERESETGKRLAEIDNVLANFKKNGIELANKYGFESFSYTNNFERKRLYGFSDPLPETDLTPFKQMNNHSGTTYQPRRNDPIGRKILNEFEESKYQGTNPDAVNEAIGVSAIIFGKEAGMAIVYLSFKTSPDFFGVKVNDASDISDLSQDLEEITSKEYKSLFES